MKLGLLNKEWNAKFKPIANPSFPFECIINALKKDYPLMFIISNEMQFDFEDVIRNRNHNLAFSTALDFITNINFYLKRTSTSRYKKSLSCFVNRKVFIIGERFTESSELRHSNTLKLLFILHQFCHRTRNQMYRGKCIPPLLVKIDHWVFYAILDYHRMIFKDLNSNIYSTNKNYIKTLKNKVDEAFAIKMYENKPPEFSYRLQRVIKYIQDHVDNLKKPK
jgi:hypothetical protein